MNRKVAAILSVLIIIVFIGYMIWDSVRSVPADNLAVSPGSDAPVKESWSVSGVIKTQAGSLKAVAVSGEGNVFLGGDSFVSSYDNKLESRWEVKTPYPVTALAVCGDSLLASTSDLIMVIGKDGKIADEWGPFETNAMITSISVSKNTVAFTDAGSKMIFILDRQGTVKKIIGQDNGQFVIPSPYFDVAVGPDGDLFVANTGHRRIEKRSIDGKLISYFGEPGTAPGSFCGCCNPAHFAVIPDGFVTAEKGLNRIKILNSSGDFVEFVSVKNDFTPSVPLDLASYDGKTIYAANPADSRLYVFTRNTNQ